MEKLSERQVELLRPHLGEICRFIKGTVEAENVNVFQILGQNWQNELFPGDHWEDEELEAQSQIPDVLEDFLYEAIDRTVKYFASLIIPTTTIEEEIDKTIKNFKGWK